MKFRNFDQNDPFCFQNSLNVTTGAIEFDGGMTIAGNFTENVDIRVKENIQSLTHI